MSNGAFPDRLTQLRNRWEADPSSRIFLQLAEEYRHQGRVREALDVLDRGLKEHAGYLSALVAKGRCHLELGEPELARTVLERVVKQDATQMVAIKLLVRAYLDTGEPERARDRLDLYSLLNDSDPEIEELRRRLHAMERPPQAEKPVSRREPVPSTRSLEAGGDVFALGAPAARRGGDVFELDAPVPRAVTPPRPDEPFAELWAPPAVSAPAAVAEVPAAVAVSPQPEEEPEPEDVLFPGLASGESRRLYLNSLAAEGLFLLDLTSGAQPAATPAPVEPRMQEPFGEPILARAPEPLPVEPPITSLAPAIEDRPIETPAVEEPWAPAEETPIVEAQPAATATLGELYLKQGHLAEAGKMFQEILRREPDNPAAHEGLVRLAARRQERRPLEARELLAGYEPGHESGLAESAARKVFLLNSYLKRLRGESQRDVS